MYDNTVYCVYSFLSKHHSLSKFILKRIDTIHVEKYNTKLPSSNRRKEQLKELFESSVSAKDAMDQFFKDLHDGLFICSTEPGLALEIFQRRSDYILEKKHP